MNGPDVDGPGGSVSAGSEGWRLRRMDAWAKVEDEGLCSCARESTVPAVGVLSLPSSANKRPFTSPGARVRELRLDAIAELAPSESSSSSSSEPSLRLPESGCSVA